MRSLKDLGATELARELLVRGYLLKSAGNGIYIKPFSTIKENPEIRELVHNRKNDLLEYLEVTYPNGRLDDILTSLTKVEKYPSNVKNMILELIDQKLSVLVDEAEACESPLEFELYQFLKRAVDSFNKENSTCFWVHIQQSIKANGRSYRADLLICPAGSEGNTERPNVIIECDGHDFHEKTKEQAQRDKKRDRDLQMAGYRVMRFTGSEIFKNAGRCAREVTDFLGTLI